MRCPPTSAGGPGTNKAAVLGALALGFENRKGKVSSGRIRKPKPIERRMCLAEVSSLGGSVVRFGQGRFTEGCTRAPFRRACSITGASSISSCWRISNSLQRQRSSNYVSGMPLARQDIETGGVFISLST